MLSHVLQNLSKIAYFFLDQTFEIYVQIPLFVGLLHRKIFLLVLPGDIDHKGVEIEIGRSNLDAFKGLLAIFGVEVVLLGVVVGKGLGRSLVVVLLQRVQVLSCLCVPDLDLAVEGGGHDDVSFLDVLQHFDRFGVGLDLPLELDGGPIDHILDDVLPLELELFLSQVALEQILKEAQLVASQGHFFIDHVQQSVLAVVATEADSQS